MSETVTGDRGRLRLRISGRVQGVWYRVSTRDRARDLGLAGWVRNRPDGTVEALAEGPREALETLRRWCHKGPPHARVNSVDAQWESPAGELIAFEVR